jgi:predicted transcriptional regulator
MVGVVRVRGLGELEAAVMDVLWQADEPLKVREVLDRLDTGKKLAYTTVMTVLNALHRKSWAYREMDGRAWQYRPTRSRAEASAQALREVLDSSADPSAVLMHFVRSASEQESHVLRTALRRNAPRR